MALRAKDKRDFPVAWESLLLPCGVNFLLLRFPSGNILGDAVAAFVDRNVRAVVLGCPYHLCLRKVGHDVAVLPVAGTVIVVAVDDGAQFLVGFDGEASVSLRAPKLSKFWYMTYFWSLRMNSMYT